MKNLRGMFLVPIKLATAKGLLEGDWFEACLEYHSTGTYKGELGLSANDLADFVANFKAGVVRRWQDAAGKFRLKVNYEHWGDTFAGWITDAELREKKLSTGETVKVLMHKAEWLPDAAKAIKNGELNYFSIEYFAGEWLYRDDQTGREYANVLVGGALTNDPFVMELAPLALSTLEEMRKKKREDEEALTALKKTQEGTMWKILLTTLGLSEAATEAEAVKMLNTLTAEKDEMKKTLSVKTAEAEKLTKELADTKTLLTAEQEKVKKFDEAEKAALTKAKEDRKAKLIALAIAGDPAKGEKIGKCSKADTEPTGFFGKLLDKDLDLAEEFLSTAKVTGFEVKGSASDSHLSTDEAMAKRIKEVMSADKISADEALKKVKAEMSKKKEA